MDGRRPAVRYRPSPYSSSHSVCQSRPVAGLLLNDFAPGEGGKAAATEAVRNIKDVLSIMPDTCRAEPREMRLRPHILPTWKMI
ncbi:unnamed protein product [Boreogadus saida]